ncbi:MAG: hemin ABC transporter substrate-binding protein [Burkholderiaceae bacterium]
MLRRSFLRRVGLGAALVAAAQRSGPAAAQAASGQAASGQTASGQAVPAQAAPAPAAPAPTAAARRVVSLGGTVTEIVEALGATERLVGVDASSLYPAAVRQLPQLGYYRNFGVEGVVSLRPELVLASDHAGPPQSLEQLRRLGIRVVAVPSGPTLDSLQQGVETVAAALALDERGRALTQRIDTEVEQARRAAAERGTRPRVLVLSSHTGKLQAAGRDTAADALLALAGAQNLFTSATSYKPMAVEAVAALAPDFIVTSPLSLPANGGLAAFIAQPGISATPAARARRVIVIDDLLLLGFGPRIGLALRQLQAGFAANGSN